MINGTSQFKNIVFDARRLRAAAYDEFDGTRNGSTA